MRERGFTPHTKTLHEVVEFYKRSEVLEKLRGVNFIAGSGQRKQQGKTEPGKVQTDSAKNSNKGSKLNADKPKTSKSSGSTKFCPLHNTSGHDLGGCKVMQDQAKKMRDNWETKKPQKLNSQRSNQDKTVSFKNENNNMELKTKNKKRKQADKNAVVNDETFNSKMSSSKSDTE